MTKTKGIPALRIPHITYRQEGGDDGYCYVVRVDGRPVYDGLTRSSARHMKAVLLREFTATNHS